MEKIKKHIEEAWTALHLAHNEQMRLKILKESIEIPDDKTRERLRAIRFLATDLAILGMKDVNLKIQAWESFKEGNKNDGAT